MREITQSGIHTGDKLHRPGRTLLSHHPGILKYDEYHYDIYCAVLFHNQRMCQFKSQRNITAPLILMKIETMTLLPAIN